MFLSGVWKSAVSNFYKNVFFTYWLKIYVLTVEYETGNM